MSQGKLIERFYVIGKFERNSMACCLGCHVGGAEGGRELQSVQCQTGRLLTTQLFFETCAK